MILTTIPTMAAGGLSAFDATLVSTSIVLVFSLLVVLCLIIMLLGKFFDWVQKKANAAALDELNAPAPSAPPASPAPAPPRGPALRRRSAAWRTAPPSKACAACPAPAPCGATHGARPVWPRIPGLSRSEHAQPAHRGAGVFLSLSKGGTAACRPF